MSNVCKDCGGTLIGDGYKTVLHCEEAQEELYSEIEPDANPVLCGFNAKSPDANVEKNRELLLERSIVGLKKYGVTTANNQLSHRQWLQHALEEALDMANYLQAAITTIDNKSDT